MNPTLFKKGKSAQLSYELPHRIHTAQIYPKKAPSGSTILIYGHTSGVRILWRGGRPLKPPSDVPKTNHKRAKTNGTHSDAIVIDDDSDDYQQAPSSWQPGVEEDAEFESDEEEIGAHNPVPSIIQHLDFSIPAEVLHIAMPKLPFTTSSRDKIPHILNDRIVFSVACADKSIRVISLPISPPSNATKNAARSSRETSKWGEEVVVIPSKHGHSYIPGGVEMTWTARSTLLSGSQPDVDMSDIDADKTSTSIKKLEWDLIVASHSADVSGVIHIFRLPLVQEQGKRSLPEDVPATLPCQTKYLSCPAVCISFSPNVYPAPRHLELLVADSKGCIKIYDPFKRSSDTGRIERVEEGLTPGQSISRLGVWTASFNTSFEVPKLGLIDAPATAERKRILDAKWATGGRSVVALLADGEWGVWDIDNTGSTVSQNPSTKGTNNTIFAISGFLVTASNLSTIGSKKQGNPRSLAPMTPNTRRTREENLFQDHSIPIAPVAHGSISIASLVSPTGGVPEDSVIIRYGTYVCRIPNLAQYWARSAGGSSGSLHGPGLTHVEGIDTRGENINGIQQFDSSPTNARLATPRDLLVAAEHRLLIVTENDNTHERGRLLFARAAEQEERTANMEMGIDQKLLAGGQLGLEGIDNLLDGMASGGAPAPTGRRVGFAA